MIPKQYELKGECNTESLSIRHVLIRATNLEEYVNMLSKATSYLAHHEWSYLMRTLKWDSIFGPEKETTTAIALIYFSLLPPNFFVREAVFSLASAIGKPH